jgi:hypothetical protein
MHWGGVDKGSSYIITFFLDRHVYKVKEFLHRREESFLNNPVLM